jgi:hypothetical protein
MLALLSSLIKASEILPTVRCAHHANEGIEDMKIKVMEGDRLILRCLLSTEPEAIHNAGARGARDQS